jgi:hypothetical protein
MTYYWLYQDCMQCPVCGTNGWYVDSASSVRRSDDLVVHRYKCVRSHMWLVIRDAIGKTSVVVVEN